MVGMRRPSFTRSGNMEKVDMVRNQGTNLLTSPLSPSTQVIKQAGTAASSIDFSCTWNEKRKKVRLVVVRLSTKFLLEGEKRRWRFAGMERVKVVARQSFARSGIDISCLNLYTTSRAHQKFATLSSNNPLLKGNILYISIRLL